MSVPFLKRNWGWRLLQTIQYVGRGQPQLLAQKRSAITANQAAARIGIGGVAYDRATNGAVIRDTTNASGALASKQGYLTLHAG